MSMWARIWAAHAPLLLFLGSRQAEPAESVPPKEDYAYPRLPRPPVDWTHWRDIPLAILAWTAVVLVGFWLASHAVQSLLVLAVSMLLASALDPLASALRRVMPRPVAVLLVTWIILGCVGFLVYLVFTQAFTQLLHLTQSKGALNLNNLAQLLEQVGIPQAQSQSMGQQIIAQIQHLVNGVVPFVISSITVLVDILLVIVLTIYFMLDGRRINRWLRTHMPTDHQHHMNFVLDTLERVVGGYVRGQLILSVLVGIFVGAGMFALHVPYAVLLGVLAFVLEFIPYLGTLTSGVICVLVALTQGWLLAVTVLLYFVAVHVLEGYVVGPRIVGRAVGLHPAVSIFALVLAAEVFGAWGALFAAPAAGIIQASLSAVWRDWCGTHPEQFKPPQPAMENGDGASPAVMPSPAHMHDGKPEQGDALT